MTTMNFNDYSDRMKALSLLPKRVQVLLAAQWAKSVLSCFLKEYPDCNGPQLAILAAENWAYKPTTANINAASRAASAAIEFANYANGASSSAAYAARSCSYAAYTIHSADHVAHTAFATVSAYAVAVAGSKWNWLEQTYKHALGPNALGPNALGPNAFGPNVSFSNDWKTTTVVSLATVAKNDISILPILADALQDAGCPEEYLSHLRCDGATTAADWCLWNLTLTLK